MSKNPNVTLKGQTYQKRNDKNLNIKEIQVNYRLTN